MNRVPIFVINLEASVERRRKMVAQLESLGWEFHIFRAVDGLRGSHPLFERYDDRLRKRFTRRPVSGGSLGNFASHYQLWQKCVDMDTPVLIMEDDVIITPFFVEGVGLAKWLIESLEFVRLTGRHRESARKYRNECVGEFGEFSLVRYIARASTAASRGYLIHPSAARKFLAHAGVWYVPVDHYMGRYWHHGVEPYELRPCPLESGDDESVMSPLPKETSWTSKIRVASYGWMERTRRTMYRIKTNI